MQQYISTQTPETVASPIHTIKEKHIENYSYDLSALIGEGSYSRVFKGRENTSHVPVAIKVVDRKKVNNPYVLKMIQQETLIMGHLNHANIVRVFEVVNTINNIYIIQEFCDGGDISADLERGAFDEHTVRKILKDVITALRVLKENGVMHRDIKPANIFLNNGVFKIGDFGFARFIDFSEEPLEEFAVGTPLYMSPQCLQSQNYSEKTDIWSLGVSLYELIHGEVPWLCSSQEELLHAIFTRKVRFGGKSVSPEMKRFIAKCLVIEEEWRMNVEEALEIVNGWEEAEKRKNGRSGKNESTVKKMDSYLMSYCDEKTVRTLSEEFNIPTEKNHPQYGNLIHENSPGISQNALSMAKKGRGNSNSWDEASLKLILTQMSPIVKSKSPPKNNLRENEEIIKSHLKYAKFLENILGSLSELSKLTSLTEKSFIKLSILLYKCWMDHLQILLMIFRDRSNIFFLERWEEFVKSDIFPTLNSQVRELYDRAVRDYKDFVSKFHSRMDLLKEISRDEKIHEILVGESQDNLVFYTLVNRELRQFIRESNHRLYEALILKGIFNQPQAKFLCQLIRFFEIGVKIERNKGEIPQKIIGIDEKEEEISKEYFCRVVRAKIYEMNI